MSTVEVTVKGQRGKCFFGHKVGDKILFDGRSVKGDVCYSALMVLLPKVYAMRYDASSRGLGTKTQSATPVQTEKTQSFSRFEEFEKRLRAGNEESVIKQAFSVSRLRQGLKPLRQRV